MEVLKRTKRGAKNQNPKKVAVKKVLKKQLKRDVARSYDQYKTHDGHQYSGMKVGGTHKCEEIAAYYE
jgi:hypothetical protein